MPGLTETLSRFAAQPSMAPMTDEVRNLVKTGFIDAIATMIAGRDTDVVQIVRSFVRQRQSTAAEAHVLFLDELAASNDAALINGCAAHALDYDDVALGGHPSTVLVPAILAEGERLNASGEQALTAYLVGYEAWAELFSRDPDPYHLKGWHPTAVLGTVGAACAVAYLNKLSVEQCSNAIALAASMASGLVANFGTMAKPLHAGRAASCAIDAVRLAAGGLTAAHDALEHHAGYLAALSPKGAANREDATGLGKKLHILEAGLSIKKYPMCYSTHRVVDGILDLAKSHAIRPEQVKSVHATIGVSQASMLRNHAPVTGLEAKFSLEFAAAAALDAGKVGLAELSDEYVSRQQVRDLMARVSIDTTDSRCPIEPVFALNDQVTIELQDGRKLSSGDIRFARGNAKLPLKMQELRSKFMDCCATAPELDAAALYDRLSKLETAQGIRDIVPARAAATA
ncbi:MAG: MmgE/PrpD family protein [Burkholderiaceae bacterium]